jgi:hypothetical protein
VIVGLVGLLAWTGYTGVRKVQEYRDRQEIEENLRILGVAFQNYHYNNDRFPPLSLPYHPGKHRWSWRLFLRPYLWQRSEGRWFDSTQAWDTPGNLHSAGPNMLKIYAPVGRKPMLPGYTCYRIFSGKESAFDRPAGVSLDDLADPANTILVVEAHEPVFWMQPEGLPYDPDGPLPPLGGTFKDGFYALMADGSVRFIRHDTDEQTIRAYITGRPVPKEK